MDTITIEQFQLNMKEIENILNRVDEILFKRGRFYRWLNLKEAKQLHELAKIKMEWLFNKELIIK